MTCKWIRKSFLIAISFLAVWLVFSCKDQNTGSDERGEFVITFRVSPEEGGSIVAKTTDGRSIKSGTSVKKDTEIIFNFTPKGNYTVDKWDGNGVEKDKDDPFMAHLKVSQDVTVNAVLKQINDPAPELKSLKMYGKDLNITDLSDVKVEVENYIQTLSSDDVEAKFTYGTHTTPEPIKVTVNKNRLNSGDTVVKLSVSPVEGSYGYWNQAVTITRKDNPNPTYVPPEVQLQAIEVARLSTKKSGGNYKYEDYVPVEGFVASKAGPFVAKDAKTAYVALKVKMDQYPTSTDCHIELTNKTTYIEAREFSRGANNDNNKYFFLKEIALSKGLNILEIKVKSPDSEEEAVYTVTLKYDGGPDPVTLNMAERKMLPGVYCAAQRKPLDGEKPDYIWMIGISGT